MKLHSIKWTTLIVALFSTLSVANAAPHTIKINSLNEIPWTWTGVAGNFLAPQTVEFKILSLTNVKREGSVTTYDVNSTLTTSTGTQVLIKQILLLNFNDSGETSSQIVFRFDSPLKLSAYLNVTYDEITRSYKMADFIENGERSMVLEAVRAN